VHKRDSVIDARDWPGQLSPQSWPLFSVCLLKQEYKLFCFETSVVIIVQRARTFAIIMSTLLWALVALTIAYTGWNIRCLQVNLVAAKRSNIPYVIVPVFTFNPFWLVTHRLWLRVIGWLPAAWSASWLK
jgi:hypothetical protein